jgi:hypothetical protein
MFDIKVTGFTLLTMSRTYTTTVGNVDACNKTITMAFHGCNAEHI